MNEGDNEGDEGADLSLSALKASRAGNASMAPALVLFGPIAAALEAIGPMAALGRHLWPFGGPADGPVLAARG